MSIQRFRQPDTCQGVQMIAYPKGEWVRYGAFMSRDGQWKKQKREMLDALRLALAFAEKEQECRQHSYLPEPTEDEEDYLVEASETVETIRKAIFDAEKGVS